MSARYCPLEERFFPSLDALHAHAVEEHALLAWRDDGGPVALPEERAAALTSALGSLVPELMPKQDFFQSRRDVIDRLQRMLDEGGFATCVHSMRCVSRVCF